MSYMLHYYRFYMIYPNQRNKYIFTFYFTSYGSGLQTLSKLLYCYLTYKFLLNSLNDYMPEIIYKLKAYVEKKNRKLVNLPLRRKLLIIGQTDVDALCFLYDFILSYDFEFSNSIYS